MFPVCYVISTEHVTKVSYDFLQESPLLLVTTLPSLVAIGIVVV